MELRAGNSASVVLKMLRAFGENTRRKAGLFEDDHPNVGLHFKRWSLEKDFLNGRAHTPRISAAISSISVWEMVHLWGAEGPPKRYQIGALAWEDDSIGWIAETFGAVFDFLTGF